MLRDFGSRDEEFIELTTEVRSRLLQLAHGEDQHVAVPLQGSGTFIIEAVIATLLGPGAKLLVLVNGAYGERIAAITRRLGRAVECLTWPEDQPISPADLDRVLACDAMITHVAMVHCETTTGLCNPLAETAAIVSRHGRKFLVDAMSSFGALPIDLRQTPITAIIASSNKCLEGVPGLGFALIDKAVLSCSRGVSPSLSFDLFEQWRGFESNGQWRFTPPVQVVAALVAALRQWEAEGGAEARLRRYQANFDCLASGMVEMGFRPFLDPKYQAPIIATFHEPDEAWFQFDRFYRGLAMRHFLIYPGKLSQKSSFRIGCIGAVTQTDMQHLLSAIRAVIAEISSGSSNFGGPPR